MAIELSEVMIGFDLCPDYSQMTFYHQNNTEPITISMVPGEEKYQFATPKDLFSLVEQNAELGIALLSNFFKESFERLRSIGRIKRIIVMVTMVKLRPIWARAIIGALEMLDIPREDIYLQDHKESFYNYVLNQKKELWNGKAALFEYGLDCIMAYEFSIAYGTRPALGQVIEKKRLFLDKKTREEHAGREFSQVKDELFLQQIKDLFEGERFTSAYLIGEAFETSWMQKSLPFLCRKCHVFQGNNLYTKGACYAAMNKADPDSGGRFLYNGPEMIEHNVGMQMIVKGNPQYKNMITAGVHYCMAAHECEFLLDDTQEVVLISKSIRGEQLTHIIELTDLPERPNRGTRIHMELEFSAPDRCRVKMDDMGMGEQCPSSGKKWNATINFREG